MIRCLGFSSAPVAAVTPTVDFGMYIQDGDLLIVVSAVGGVHTPSWSISGSGWTELANLKQTDVSNTRISQWWRRHWSTGDPTTVTVTQTANADSTNVAIAFICRSNYVRSSSWTFTDDGSSPGVASTGTAGGTSVNSISPVFPQLTPTDAARDLRFWMMETNSPGPTPGLGLWPADASSTGIRPAYLGAGSPACLISGQGALGNAGISLGRGKQQNDSGSATGVFTTNSQTLIIRGICMSDGDTSDDYSNLQGFEFWKGEEIDAETDIEGLDASSPSGLGAAAGRFEGGSHIY